MPPSSHRQPLLMWPAIMAVAVIALALPRAPAGAQEPPDDTIDLTLVGQPIWHKPTDPLNLRLRISNKGPTPIEGFLLSLTAHPAVSSRSALHEVFEGSAGAIVSAIPITFDTEIGPGEAEVVEVDEPVASLSSLAAVQEGGVYPVTVTLSDAEGVNLYDFFTTPLIIYEEAPEVPLNLALVIPLNALPSRDPGGVFHDPLASDGVIPAQEAVAESGWLSGLVDVLVDEAGELPPLTRTVRVTRGRGPNRQPRLRQVQIRQRGLHVGIAPTARFAEELADLGSGYQRSIEGRLETVAEDAPSAENAREVLDRLGSLLREEGIQPLLGPYSFPDLPALARHAPERIQQELSEAREVVARVLEIQLSNDWVFPPAGRIGAQTLEEIRFADAETAQHTLFHPASFTNEAGFVEGCPQSFASFACTVRVRTSAGPTVGLVGDEGLQDRFADLVQPGDIAQDLQNFFAETASIRQELPSIAGRVVQVTMPSLWHPQPATSRRLLGGMRAAPWLRTVTPEEGIKLAEPSPRSADFVESIEPLRREPDSSLFLQIQEATEFLDDFRRMQPPDELLDRLRRNLLVAESRLWWTSDDLLALGDDYVEATVEEAQQQIEQLTVGGPSEINLTAREGEIPLVVSNQAGFPTTVSVQVRAGQPDLDVTPQSVPPQAIESDETFQFTVNVTARSSGISFIDVVVTTADGSLELASKRVIVRSTQFNRVALGVTLGALAFLIAFYLFRLFRRARRGSAA